MVGNKSAMNIQGQSRQTRQEAKVLEEELHFQGFSFHLHKLEIGPTLDSDRIDTCKGRDPHLRIWKRMYGQDCPSSLRMSLGYFTGRLHE